ncbi:hypothetical protein GCM10027562_11520 [Arthrobacter pigmenti]
MTGIALVPEFPGGIALLTDADMLGTASVHLESLSLVTVEGTEEVSLGVPTGPAGERRQFASHLSISAREDAGSLYVDVELPRLLADSKDCASASWEEAPPGPHILLVDTHIMGRAEMQIARLRFRYVG